jgi:ribulose-5-phosphate 4-epimerase/fuculose-1-phosphate aldolase
MSGTPEFAELVLKTMGNGPAVIWGNHGAMVVGVNLPLTFSIAHALEDSAKVYTIAKQLGTPAILPPDEVKKLHDFWQKNYGQKALETEVPEKIER